MKKILSTAAAALAAASAYAGFNGVTQPFNVTNVLTATAASYSGWPSVSTYGSGVGVPVNVSQLDNLVLCVQGTLYSTNASGPVAVSVSLTTSEAGGGGPQVVSGTNIYSAATAVQYNDWATVQNPALVFTFILPAGTTNGAVNLQANVCGMVVTGTNTAYTYVTGLNTNYATTATMLQTPSVPSAASWLGVSAVSATGLGTGGLLTNLTVTVTGKQRSTILGN